MPEVWTRQHRPIWIVLLLFIVGILIVMIWNPVLIQGFPLEQFLEWYIVSGLLLLGLTAASKDESAYAPVFGLYALAIVLLVATPIPELLAKLGALMCFALGIVLAHDPDGTNTNTSTASE